MPCQSAQTTKEASFATMASDKASPSRVLNKLRLQGSKRGIHLPAQVTEAIAPPFTAAVETLVSHLPRGAVCRGAGSPGTPVWIELRVLEVRHRAVFFLRMVLWRDG